MVKYSQSHKNPGCISTQAFAQEFLEFRYIQWLVVEHYDVIVFGEITLNYDINTKNKNKNRLVIA